MTLIVFKFQNVYGLKNDFLEDEFYLLKVDMTSTKCVNFYFKVPGIAELLKYTQKSDFCCL